MKKLMYKFQQFMMGRYGNDKLSNLLLVLFIISSLASILTKNIGFQILSLLILVLTYFRMFSKNIYARTQENLKYLKVLNRIKGFFIRIKEFPKYKIFKCPECGQKLRVPRRKGVINITCRKCHHKFEGKS